MKLRAGRDFGDDDGLRVKRTKIKKNGRQSKGHYWNAMSSKSQMLCVYFQYCLSFFCLEEFSRRSFITGADLSQIPLLPTQFFKLCKYFPIRDNFNNAELINQSSFTLLSIVIMF